MPMFRYILRRLVSTVPVLLCAVTLTFFMMRFAPGGPFSAEREYSAESLAQLEAFYGLDAPLATQYGRYLLQLLHGDLGLSFLYPGVTVNEIIAQRFPVSLELGLWALLVALVIGMTAGILAALRPNTLQDHLSMGVAMAGICVPSFVLGPVLILIFALGLGWFNSQGWYEPRDRVLPAITLGTAYAAYIARLARAGMLDVLPREFIRTARAKGVPEWKVIMLHALKPGIFPVVAFLGPAVAGLVTGSFVTETIFRVPGLGTEFVQSAVNRDYTLVLGLVVFYATLVVAFNLLVDIAQALLNPQIRHRLS
jgi:oligopeptide transport system permease protein